MAERATHPITIVHTEFGMCLTTTAYSDWREIQSVFDDYKTSLGPFESDELIEYLAVEYPTDAPFDAWDVRGIAGYPEAVTWAASADLPIGAGLKLGTTRGDSLRLAIDGYQFPSHEDRRMRDSWYFVEGEATVDGRNWKFRSQALTCDTAPLLVAWLLRLEEWITAGSSDDAPKPPWLIEPNLQFPEARNVNGRAEITVELDLEFLPPDRRSGRQGAGKPEVLRLRATAAELQQAAIDFAATMARFPTGPGASRPVSNPPGGSS